MTPENRKTLTVTVTGNRSVGLLREVADTIQDEDNELELWRLERSLRLLSQQARGRRQAMEQERQRIQIAGSNP